VPHRRANMWAIVVLFQVIQQRVDGKASFFKTWRSYKRGFGRVDKNSDFWLG